MRHLLATVVGKTVRVVAKLRGGGSALPGLIAEKIDPEFLPRTLGRLPHGVVVISGTNGKTTTTKMVVELLQGQGLKVFTNRTGSNFTRGVVAAVLGESNPAGKLGADIAVLELDEAHAVHFVKLVPPRYSLLLNVMRDQLDRFGEIETTAGFLRKIAEATTEAVVLNREDHRIAGLAAAVTAPEIRYFGLTPDLRRMFPGDDEMRSGATGEIAALPDADVVLSACDGPAATFTVDGRDVDARLKLTGVYNVYNSAAALALARTVLGEAADEAALLRSLEAVTPAFGRGESLTVNGQPLDLVLVKNPAGFRLALKSFPAAGFRTMIAINDNYADGRDMSWLWDVDFDSLAEAGVDEVSGVRANDMALRLFYEDVPVGRVDTDLTASLRRFIELGPGQPKRIYCTYTAMLALRRELGKLTEVEVVS
ncbi:Mur ligase family protein [Arthrobacter mangrovi]|uniref:Lipid II isoglutaminyl synthase (glutamine-hydrolyzing) subunit MurT n=1 Tax=Arthrobacter mangrovi TaxID=2966350 RepID=A0ABQ5MU00_9MICC|nr:Mur ligase family protein [Arthrobacter mangrovi]GLB67443.1 glutamate ligase [Arthrobacter mangrovi]